MAEHEKSHVVVLGAGFGGLTFCQHFRHPAARVTVVDRTNHHLFQPLLYQVATAGLSAPEIAQPIRSILAHRPDITVLLDQVVDIDLASRQVFLEKSVLPYDYLVLALGGCTSYFGHPEWEQFAPGLKTLEDALRIRSRVLLAFEKAETRTDPAEREALLTIVIVGGGPTGVELAGAFAELARTVLKRDFRRIDPDPGAHHLASRRRRRCWETCRRICPRAPGANWNVWACRSALDTEVSAIQPGEVTLATGETIRAGEYSLGRRRIRRAAYRQARRGTGSQRTREGESGLEPARPPGSLRHRRPGSRAPRKTASRCPGSRRPRCRWPATSRALCGDELDLGPGRAPRPPFKYWDRGTMATIGRSAAVAWIGRLHFSGLFAWLAWLLVHLIFLIGFRNKLAVLLQWAYSYFAYKRGARIITGLPREPVSGPS